MKALRFKYLFKKFLKNLCFAILERVFFSRSMILTLWLQWTLAVLESPEEVFKTQTAISHPYSSNSISLG